MPPRHVYAAHPMYWELSHTTAVHPISPCWFCKATDTTVMLWEHSSYSNKRVGCSYRVPNWREKVNMMLITIMMMVLVCTSSGNDSCHDSCHDSCSGVCSCINSFNDICCDSPSSDALSCKGAASFNTTIKAQRRF